MHKKIKFFKNELLNMIKLTQFIKKISWQFWATILLQSIHCLNSRVSLSFVNERLSSNYCISKY